VRPPAPAVRDAESRRGAVDLALIGNSCAAALVDRNDRIAWWCFRHFYFDSDPVFSRLLAGDEEKGFSDVTLAGLAQTQSGYQRNTAIAETILPTRTATSCGSRISRRASSDSSGRSGRRKSSGSNRSPACRASPPSDSSPRTFIRTPASFWGNLPHSYSLAG